MRVATDFLKGRIVEANLADLNKDEDQNYRKIRLQLLVRFTISAQSSGETPLISEQSGCVWQALPQQLLRNGHDNR